MSTVAPLPQEESATEYLNTMKKVETPKNKPKTEEIKLEDPKPSVSRVQDSSSSENQDGDKMPTVLNIDVEKLTDMWDLLESWKDPVEKKDAWNRILAFATSTPREKVNGVLTQKSGTTMALSCVVMLNAIIRLHHLNDYNYYVEIRSLFSLTIVSIVLQGLILLFFFILAVTDFDRLSPATQKLFRDACKFATGLVLFAAVTEGIIGGLQAFFKGNTRPTLQPGG